MCGSTTPAFTPTPSFRLRLSQWQASRTSPFRIAVVGKGGTGKTTIAGALARVLANRGLRILAIDADPDANLGSALPLDEGILPVPLAQQVPLLQTAAGVDELPTGLIQLNPDTSGLLPKCLVGWGQGNSLISIGWSKSGGQGCYCAEHAVLKRLLSQASRRDADVTVIDSEAGLEHLSRGTIANVDLVLVVIEPGLRSVETALAVRKLAADLAIPNAWPVITRLRNQTEQERVCEWLHGWTAMASFPQDEEIRSADLEGRLPQLGGSFLSATESLADAIMELGKVSEFAA